MTGGVTDDYLRLLEHRDRRLILETLLSRPNTAVSVKECLDRESDSMDIDEECERHIDMLERADAIVYDETARTVSRGQRFDDIEPFVRAVSRATEPHDFKQERDQIELINRGLTHDLLSTLNTIQARTALLNDSEGDIDGHDHLDVVESGVEEMIARVETMSAFTDTVVSNGTHKLGDYEMGQVIDDEISKLQGLNGADITKNGVPEVVVRADERLSLVFENLLRNAIEHNNTDSPTVRITGECRDGNVEVAIKDDGPGFPNEAKENLLEDGGMGTDSNGTGFGLHFVKRTLDTYGGGISIKDRESSDGAAVMVRLGLVKDADASVVSNQ